MKARKTVDVEFSVEDLDCDECGERARRAICERCLEHERDSAHDDAIANYTPEKEETTAPLRDWIDREKALGRLSPVELAALERCADDLEAVH